MKFGGSVRVYDNSRAAGSLLWDFEGASLTVPPIITSTNGPLFVVYTSDSSNPDRYDGFFGEYYSNYVGSVGSGRTYTTLAMSSAIDIFPPGDGSNLTPGTEYTWYIQPSAITGPITFCFSQLDLFDPSDRVTIYDGPTINENATVLGVFKGTSLPKRWITTTGRTASIRFTSPVARDAADPTGNFKISYMADGPNYHCGFTTNPARLTAHSMRFSDGSHSLEEAYDSEFCQWDIVPAESTSVVLFFSRFSLQRGSLKIYKGPTGGARELYATIADTVAVPAPLILTNMEEISIEYSTTSKVQGYGFGMTYYGIGNSNSFPGDRLVELFCSSMVSLSLIAQEAGSTVVDITPATNLTWLIRPTSSSGRLYFIFSQMKLEDCNGQLVIYDGPTMDSPSLGTFCGSSLPIPWIQTSGEVALLNFVSNEVNHQGNFDLSFYSDGPNFHCGFAVNPAHLSSPSMVFTDGSSGVQTMYAGQLCEWKIEPTAATGSGDVLSDEEADMVVVLEILECDLQGGVLQVYKGIDETGELLWSCDGCSAVPPPFVSSGRQLFVHFSTATAEEQALFGRGFRAVYWTTSSSSWREEATPTHVLQLPQRFSLDNDLGNKTAAFVLSVTNQTSNILFSPSYTAASTSASLNDVAVDGRQTPTVFESLDLTTLSCGGVISGSQKQRNILWAENLYQKSTQSLGRYVRSRSDFKALLNIKGDTAPADEADRSTPLASAGLCKYRLDSGTTQAITIRVQKLELGSYGRLRIYGGLYGNDNLLFDSNYKQQWDDLQDPLSPTGVMTVTAPCGQSTIVLEVNSTLTNATSVEQLAQYVDYSMDLSYAAVTDDQGIICLAYIASLLPPARKEDPWVPYYVAATAIGGFAIICMIIYYIHRTQTKWGYVCYRGNETSARRYIKRVTPDYPSYSGKWDHFRNRFFLKKGSCQVCQNLSIPVMKLGCGHGLCVEDARGYLESALGDISMFPVKCPMHFQGCNGVVEAMMAKRILNRIQYEKFIEFSDRAMYGDGMRCIFCNNYVSFPETMNNTSRVTCPYCVQNFCLRCKRPWHAGIKCGIDSYDSSLEMWKKESGAQKCPACLKLIEKDDPDTCNHMVHKCTDGIPCVRDRTDFCYLCGEEILGDYPHDEVNSPGVNHFPEGVFQKCRHILWREQEAERERLRRQKKSKKISNNKVNPTTGVDLEEGSVASGVRSARSSRSRRRREGVDGPQQSPFPVGSTMDEQWSVVLGEDEVGTPPSANAFGMGSPPQSAAGGSRRPTSRVGNQRVSIIDGNFVFD